MAFKTFYVIAIQTNIVSGSHYIVRGEKYKVIGRAPKFKLIIERDSNNKKAFVSAKIFKKDKLWNRLLWRVRENLRIGKLKVQSYFGR